jgi:hypothetical protein
MVEINQFNQTEPGFNQSQNQFQNQANSQNQGFNQTAQNQNFNQQANSAKGLFQIPEKFLQLIP